MGAKGPNAVVYRRKSTIVLGEPATERHADARPARSGNQILAGRAGVRYLTFVLLEGLVARTSKRLTTVVSTKGQVILPKAVRDRRHWSPGTRLTVEDTADGVVLKASPLFPPTTIEAVFGMLAYKGPPLSIADMNAAVAAVAKRRARD